MSSWTVAAKHPPYIIIKQKSSSTIIINHTQKERHHVIATINFNSSILKPPIYYLVDRCKHHSL